MEKYATVEMCPKCIKAMDLDGKTATCPECGFKKEIGE